MSMSRCVDEPEEPRCLESQGQALLRASIFIMLYALYPKLPSSDIELLQVNLCSSTSLEFVMATTMLQEVLRKHAQLSAPAWLPALLVHAVRRSSFDVVQSAMVEAFAERAAEMHDQLPTLRARAAVQSVPTQAASPPPAAPDNVKVDPSYISLLSEWTQRDATRRIITWSDRATGPSHLRTFEVECKLNDEVVGRGAGQQKKAAKAQAAYDAALHLGLVAEGAPLIKTQT